MATTFFHKQISGPFTIPSGIVSTTIPVIARILREIPELGVITTKSVGLKPRAGNREPILGQYAPGSFINAVGLTNPGAEAFAREAAALTIPKDRFFLTSIFGSSADELAAVARIVAPVSDGLELNLSCPHARGYGMDIGQNPDLVREIVAAVRAAVELPIVAKVTPNVSNVAEIAAAAAAGGADGICAINTVGPGYYTIDGQPLLTNQLGGLSGAAVLPIGLKCVKQIADAVDLPIIGCGGIGSARDVRAFRSAGASIYGVGSALLGLTTDEMGHYFRALAADLNAGTDTAAALLRHDVAMDYTPYTLQANRRLADDLAVLVFDRPIKIRAGEFIFVWVPGLGEKPFSVLDDDPFTLVAVGVGEFTNHLVQMAPGDVAYTRGPHGIAVAPRPGAKIIAVSGGTGLAAVYQICRDFDNAELFFGARSAERLYYIDQCAASCPTHIATNDGSRGFHGLVTEALRARLSEMAAADLAELVFYNCGPEVMINAATAVQLEFTAAANIYNAIDYVTKCGVGICGVCCAADGRRLCVDGPFLQQR